MPASSPLVLTTAVLLLSVPFATVAAQSTPADACGDPRQVEVFVLGTFHMEQHAEDILGARRQAEIEALVTELAELAPTHVALEAGIGWSGDLQAAYRAYVDEDQPLTANERQQIGFRLARRLGHDRVHAVDYPLRIGNDSIGAFYGRHPELLERYGWIVEAAERRGGEASERLESSTIPEYLRWLNSEEALRGEANNLMYAHVLAGEGDNYGGPQMLEKWYARNIRIVHHVARLAQADDDRILLVIGAGHVRPVRDLLRLAPQYCPVNPIGSR